MKQGWGILMNKNQLNHIFNNYIEKFTEFNDDNHSEYYKWQVCYKYKKLMDEALESSDEEFAEALNKVKMCTENIIDSYTQPFYGLVELARKEPKTVRQMFKDLYSDNCTEPQKQMELIQQFFDKSNALLKVYYPESFLYKQTSHSVSAYLFLYDPDHHYMYKATQSKIMADCIEFYDDWGTGDNIKLDVYYRMCDQILEEIKHCPELLNTNQSRYDGRLNFSGGELHADPELHILLFDIIYCAHIYNLYDGIMFSRPKMKEKQLITERREKAKEIQIEYEKVKKQYDLLDEAMNYFVTEINKSKIVKHKTAGICDVISVDRQYIKIKAKSNGVATLSARLVLRMIDCR